MFPIGQTRSCRCGRFIYGMAVQQREYKCHSSSEPYTETYAYRGTPQGCPGNIPSLVHRLCHSTGHPLQCGASCRLPLKDYDANLCQMKGAAEQLLLYFCGVLANLL